MRYLVTGASSGIGLAVARMLLERGAHVVGLSRTAGPAVDHGGYRHVAVDLADLEAVRAVSRELSRQEPWAGAVFNAGAGRFGGLEELGHDDITGLVDLNLSSVLLLARTLVPVLKRAGRGDLIFIGSEVALSGGRYGAVYAATKAGIAGFARALRIECAGSGVRVGVINPGMVRTAFFDDLPFEPGPATDNAVALEAVAAAVASVLDAPPGTVLDEINLSPQKRVVRRRSGKSAP